MIKQDLFDKENLDIFIPNDGVEFIYSILQSLGYRDFTTKVAREHGLKIINQLFALDLIEIFHWGNYNKIFKNVIFNKIQTLRLIENIWFEGADYSDFIGMIIFKHKDWYIKALEKEGFTHTKNWENFVKEKIGNLEKWIKQNRPKK